ncbi:MAG: hypothetical protein L0Y50_04725 [Beijerinckiaceae bacterium]|nr:hypothetical protein [Beijerinckiaceae bacterium]
MSKSRPAVAARPRYARILIRASVSFALGAYPAPPWPAVALDAAVKQDLPLTPPLPPPRPASPAGALIAPNIQPAAAIPAAPADAPVPPQEPPRQPRSLPAATRARMHACGFEWQKLKETGGAADKTWFEFAQICLVK